MESKNQQNNRDIISVKPSYWGWLWFLVPWIVVITVYPLISGDVAILESPLIIFALIVVVPRIISTYRTKYTITLNQIEIVQGSLLGSQKYDIPLIIYDNIRRRRGRKILGVLDQKFNPPLFSSI